MRTRSTVKVVDESLASADLATNSVTATEVADNSIDSGEIDNDTLLASDLASSSVATWKSSPAPSTAPRSPTTR